MTAERDPATRERTSDSVWLTYARPVLIATITSFIGGMSGAWSLIQLTAYKVDELQRWKLDVERHKEADDKKFAELFSWQAVNNAEHAAIRERLNMHIQPPFQGAP